jgi:hypothetical protein
MASFVDAYWFHNGCPPPPNPCLHPRAPHYSIDQEMYQQIFDRGGPLACRTHKPFPLCRQWYLQVAPADAAVFAMFRSGHLPEPNLDGLHGPPDSPAPATRHTDSTCPWCRSEVTLSGMTSSARDLPWLHIIHRLLLCPAGQRRPPLFKFCSGMLLLTSDWPNYHCRLGILFADLSIHPSAPASSCTPSAHLLPPFTLTFSACLLISLDLRIHLRDFQTRSELIASCKCLQSLPVSYVVHVLLSLPHPLSNLLHVLVPPLALQTPLLP